MDSRFQVLCCFLVLLASCNATPKTLQVRCKSGEFLKQYPLFSCGRCDENCAIGKCLDIKGCDECESGYYLSREADLYPYKCHPCEIEGCAKCKDDVYNKDGATCAAAADGYEVAHEGKNCVKVEEPAPVTAVKSEAPEEEVVVSSTPEKTTPVVSEPKTEEYEATPSAVSASTEKKEPEPTSATATPSAVAASTGEKEYDPSTSPVEATTAEPSTDAKTATKVESNSASVKASVTTVSSDEDKPVTVAVVSSATTKKGTAAKASHDEKKEEKPYKARPSPATKEEVKVPATSADAVVTETPVVETPVVETPVVETPVVETPVVETPVVETPVVETPVVETPVVETPVGSTAGESVTKPTTTEPVVEEKESILCAYPEGCKDGYYFNIKSCKCEACDVNCVLGKCENDKGCTLCKLGYFIVRTESADSGKCVKCTIPYCKICSAGIFGLSPVQCVECKKGYKLSDDKKSCTKIKPVVVNKSLYCPLGQFYKTEGKMCVDCDPYCKPGYCEDDKGCMKCKPGYYTSREDAFWPRKCVPCDIKNCAECVDNVYDHWTPKCSKCDVGYELCHGDTACRAY